MKRLPSEILAEIVDEEEDEEKYGLLSHFSDTEQMVILEEMSSDEITDLVSVLDEAESEDVLSKMNVEDRQEVRELLSYDADTAGGLMATEFISLSQHMSVLQTLEYLQKAAQDAEMAYYLYVVDQSNVLTGVVSLREIVAHSFDTLIRDIANPNVISVPASTDQEEVARIFSKYSFLMMPVVDEHDHILGVITVDDVMDIIEEENTEDIHRLAQINEEEKVDGSLIESLKSRLPWLLINLLTAFLASSVVAVFSGTIEKVVALAAVNPIIAGMGGNAGTQSLTIVVRGIALGELTGDNARRVFFKEFGVGILSGVSIGLVVALICGVMQQNPIFGLVVGLAMLLNMAFATIAGYAVPVILKKINVDPALASSVFVTTVTDVLGFFFFLGLATLFLPYLI